MNVKAVLVIGMIAMQAEALWAQIPTGRTRTVTTTQEQTQDLSVFQDTNWFLAAGAGVLASGTLFRVASDDPARWQPPGGPVFTSKDFTVLLDEDFCLVLTLGRRLGSRSWVRLNLSSARMNMLARAWVGQGTDFYLWDKLSIVLLGLDLEHRLVAQTRYPYLLLGGAGIAIKGNDDSTIDQSRLALRFGGGYGIQFGGVWGLRAEIRHSVTALEFDDYQPGVEVGSPPSSMTVEERSSHNFWEIIVKLTGQF